MNKMSERIAYDNTARNKFMKGMIIQPLAFNIGAKITKAMLLEAVCSPKPGLVDRFNSGAHHDMDITTYMISTATISHYMTLAAQIALEHRGEMTEILPKLRSIGVSAEEEMFLATNGVNTQKGLIFSGMIIAAAASYISARETGSLKVTRILSVVQEITKGIVERELMVLDKNEQKITAGEWIFLDIGVTGIRGEAEKGFPNADAAYQVINKAIASGIPLEKSMIMALLFLMTRVDDTNILSRHGSEALTWVKQEANKLVLCENTYSDEWLEKVHELDKQFIEQNISPGGCADLLAVALMLYFLANDK
ncbi:MAG: triphosphoribosyl-dephospho-CoA synthase CitG [Candidatus Heimdallarchaeota archaeon]|nr:triphosphoribosyl-dephospho-CoA synthase CitG [Candidatus Heimdallarchaeota archaeon]